MKYLVLGFNDQNETYLITKVILLNAPLASSLYLHFINLMIGCKCTRLGLVELAFVLCYKLCTAIDSQLQFEDTGAFSSSLISINFIYFKI